MMVLTIVTKGCEMNLKQDQKKWNRIEMKENDR